LKTRHYGSELGGVGGSMNRWSYRFKSLFQKVFRFETAVAGR
jgi:hypothetical protein